MEDIIRISIRTKHLGQEVIFTKEMIETYKNPQDELWNYVMEVWKEESNLKVKDN